MTVVLLDRDGVINRNRDDYVKNADELAFLPGALEGLAKLKEAGATTVVISNQAGVGRGLIAADDFKRINERIREAVRDHGGEIAGFYYCLHRKDENCECRKPKTGLFLQASSELGFDLHGAFFVGDSESDIEAGRKAGCRTVLVLTGLASAEDVESWSWKPHHIAADLGSAVDHILATVAEEA